MELFSIERYSGDTLGSDCPVDEHDVKEQETKRMRKLLKQAKGRKRQRDQETLSINTKVSKHENTTVVNQTKPISHVKSPLMKSSRARDCQRSTNTNLKKSKIENTSVGDEKERSLKVKSVQEDQISSCVSINTFENTSSMLNQSKRSLKVKSTQEDEGLETVCQVATNLENTANKFETSFDVKGVHDKISSIKGKSVKARNIELKDNINMEICGENDDDNDMSPSKSDQNIDNKLTNNEMTIIGGEKKKQKMNIVQRVLPKWLDKPFYFIDDILPENLMEVDKISDTQLDQMLITKLLHEGIKHFFPVQQIIIPNILSCWEEQSVVGRAGYLPSDICVCAPTGSGKTLAYVLPIIQLLQATGIRQLSALVIVPTKDLASQVCNVFKVYARGTALKIGLANGLKNLQREANQLGKTCTTGNYKSYVDILVATPGRLVEHISSSLHAFTLKYLRFFVIDEADRLLSESYFGWLDKVYTSVYSTSISRAVPYRSVPQFYTPSWCEQIQRPLQKLLFSATLTQNPEKLVPLQLYKPKLFTVGKSSEDDNTLKEGGVHFGYTPTTLQESMYICNNGGKPLVLLYLLTETNFDRVLCFTSSVEATHRLYLLIKYYGEMTVAEYSSTLTAIQRKAILNDFNTGKIRIIICSDAMARGLDLERVHYVVSYDPPVSCKTYIHRVGRTARAGKNGNAVTLLHDTEVYHFKKMLKSLGKSKLPKHSIKDDVLQPLIQRYETALEKVKHDIISKKKTVKR